MYIQRILFACLIIFCLFTALFHSAHAASGTDTMVGYWKFDETTQGSNATDSSGGGFTGTPSGTGGGPSINTGVPTTSFPDARSATFNGTDQYFDMGTSSSLFSTTFSASAWVYPTEYSNNYTRIFQQRGTTGGGGFDLEFDSGDAGCGDKQVYGVVWNSSGTATRVCMSSGTISLNTWNHVVFTYSGGTLTLYVNATDGLSDGTATATLAAPNSYRFYVGRSSDGGTNFFKGSIDELRLYNRVLSTTEITALASGNHTSATWDGSSSTNTETAANWDINVIPDPYTLLTIADVTNDPVSTANLSMAGLTISTGGNLSLAGFNMSFNDTSLTTGLATISGTLTLQGGEALSNFTYSNSATAGTVLYNGSGTYASGLVAGDIYYDLTFNGTGAWTLDAALDVNGNLTITDGTLATGGNNITLGGNWSNSDTFTHGNATVTLDGTSQTISGTTTFYNLTKSVTTARTLTFEADATQTIANTFTLSGQSGALLSLRSSGSPTQWKIDPQGTRSITYVDVQDSNNTNATAIAYSSTNTYGSNLTNWTTTAPTSTPTPTPTPTSSSSSSSSNSSSAPTCGDSVPSSTPDLFQIDSTQTSATLYFTPIQGISKYYISYSTNVSAEEHGVEVNLGSEGVQNYTLNLLSPGITYYFKVRGQNGCMPGGWSTIKSAMTTSIVQELVSYIPDVKLDEKMNDLAKKAAEIPIVEKVVEKKIEITKTDIQSKPSLITHFVKTGDSLWSIAREVLGAGTKYASVVEQNIKQYPQLVSNLVIGSKLTIQKEDPPIQEAGSSKRRYDLDVKILASNGDPLQGVKVTLHSTPRTETTSQKGIARFKGVEEGEHKVYLAYGGYDGGGQAIDVTGDIKNIELVMQIDLKAGFSHPAVIAMVSVMGIIIVVLLFIIFKKRLVFAKAS